jgi:hypothetical protein
MHANLGYQPEVPNKFQPNRIAHGWEIPIFVRPRLQTDRLTDWQTTDYRHEPQEAGKTIVRCDLPVATDKNIAMDDTESSKQKSQALDICHKNVTIYECHLHQASPKVSRPC